MKVILLEDVEKLGEKGAIVDVKNGFARNFIIPKGFGVLASESNLRSWNNEKATRERKAAKGVEKAKQTAQEIGKKKYVIKAKVGEENKLFGSITSMDIVKAVLEQAKIEIDKKHVILDEPIKKTGIYKISARIYKGVMAEINLEIVSE